MSVISFIIGAYGDFKPLRTCLSSLLDQTYPSSEIELIVVDNTPDMEGASRNRELCLYLDPSIRYEWTADRTNIRHLGFRHNYCLYTATEIGVQLATGDWIGFPNADSYFCRAYVERMLSKAEEGNYDMVLSDIVLGRHDHRPYVPMSCRPVNCGTDKTNFIMKHSWFTGFKEKWTGYEIADGYMIDDLVARGIKWGKVDELLCVHN